MNKPVDFSKILLRERILRGWSRKVLAEKVGVDTKTVKRWEDGKFSPQSFARQNLIEVLGMTIPELGLFDEDVNVVPAPASCDEQEATALTSDNEQAEVPISDDEQVAEISASQADSQGSQSHRQTRRTRQAKGNVLCTYDAHASWVLAVDWEPAGEHIASAGGDGVVRIWDANTTETLKTYRGHTWLFQRVNWLPTIYTLAWSPKGGRLASAGDGRKVYVWDANGDTIQEYEGHSGVLSDVFALAWSPNGKYIASACSMGGFDKTVHVWIAESGHKTTSYNASYGLMPHFSISSLAWSHHGDRLAAACGDKTIRIWDTTNGRLALTIPLSSDWVYTIAWSPDDQYLALAHGNATAEILNAYDGENVLIYRGHQQGVRDIAWSPDGKHLATASNDTTVQLWSARNGSCLYTFEKHTSWTTAVTWSPDGTRIASSSNDKTVRVWQAL